MRPFGPLPWTSSSGTPSSRASFRIAGDACGSVPVGAAGSCAGSAAVGTCRSVAGGALGTCAGGPLGAGGLDAPTRSSAGDVAAPAVTAELGGNTAPALLSTIARTLPCDTLSPTFTFNALTTPAALDGISIDALSLSTVTRLCSSATVSPGLTSSSITATWSKSPMSGTTTSTSPPGAADCARGPSVGAAGAGDGGAAGVAAAEAGAAAGAGAAAAGPSPSSSSSSDPSLTLSPTLTFISLTTPAVLDGISIDALSLSTVTSDCSAATWSPGLTRTSITSTSLKSPMSGTLTSRAAMLLFFLKPPSGVERIDLVDVDLVARDRLGDLGDRHAALF